MAFSPNEIYQQVQEAARELISQARHTRPGDFLVLGCSTSEIQGGPIGKDSNQEIGEAVIEALMEVCQASGLELAVQGCEHINRALVVERSAMLAQGLEEVNVLPQLHAGGAASVAAWKFFKDPVCVEHLTASLGLDIGDTEIGMHIRHVQKPVRLENHEVGRARVTALVYRPKLVGGSRAHHQD